jgi:DNA-binding MarR family transcriptional regulator
MRAMSHVYHHEPCAVGEVAAGIGVSLATASELLDRLTDAGWVERGVDPADRRRAVVTLTPHARALGKQVHEARRRQIAAAFAGLGEEEQRGFIVGLQAVIGSLNEALKPESSCGKADRPSFTTP